MAERYFLAAEKHDESKNLVKYLNSKQAIFLAIEKSLPVDTP